jgi:hypothetical protein
VQTETQFLNCLSSPRFYSLHSTYTQRKIRFTHPICSYANILHTQPPSHNCIRISHCTNPFSQVPFFIALIININIPDFLVSLEQIRSRFFLTTTHSPHYSLGHFAFLKLHEHEKHTLFNLLAIHSIWMFSPERERERREPLPIVF